MAPLPFSTLANSPSLMSSLKLVRVRSIVQDNNAVVKQYRSQD